MRYIKRLGYLRVRDKKLVESSLNKLIYYFCEFKYGNVERPIIKVTRKEEIIEESVDRDKALTEMGVKFTKVFYEEV